MQPSELTFCVHSLAEMEDNFEPEGKDYQGFNIITFCPAEYWKEHKCLPDYYFADQIDDNLLPEGYKWYLCVEECQWATKKSKEEIYKDMSELGFTKNLEMEAFLSGCWG